MTARKTITVQGEGKSVTITLGEFDDGAGGGGGWGGEPIMQNLIASGDCGEDVKWKLDSSGLLYIYGKGPMMFCGSYDGMPWYANRSNVKKVVIGSNITFISNWAFADCANLTSVTIPDSVTSIGEYAFHYCDNLTDVYYTGTQVQWEAISIFSDNDPLITATIHYHAAANAVAPVVKVPKIPEELGQGEPLGTLMPPAETTEGDALFTSRFDGLNAGMDYVLLVVKDWAATDLLTPENLLYIAQGTAAADGTLSFTYMLSGTESAWPIVGGWLMGDVNGDDRVDGKDIVTLARHIAKIERITDANKRKLADVNGDTVVNAADLTALTKVIQKNKT